MGADREYAILTAEISKAAFGMTPSEYKKFKGLTKRKSSLGEASTSRITRAKNTKGFPQNKQAAKREELSLEMPGKNWKREAAKKFPQNKLSQKFPEPQTSKK